MKKIIFAVLVQLLVLTEGYGQTFQVDTLQYKGAADKYINIVMMGDGYTAAQQSKFISDAIGLSNYVFATSPWSNYVNYFNVFAIKVISSQSGAAHPNTSSDCNTASPLVPVSNPNTYFGCSFDSYSIHRLIVATKTSNVANVLSANFPNYDQVFILANSPYYGGSGGSYATLSIDTESKEVAAHEIGHSFANLADEYYAGDVYSLEKPNMTQQTNSASVKWKNWMGYNGVGIYQHCCGGNSALWYKPHQSCKMGVLNNAFCSVCKEAIIEKIHSLVNPVVNYTPVSANINTPNRFIDFKLTKLMKPVSNTLKIVWDLNGNTIAKNIDSIQVDQNQLTGGTHTLKATVVDTTTLLRINNHSTVHSSAVTWTIKKTITGIQLSGTDNKITCSIFPNPASNSLTVSVQLEKKSKLFIQIVSSDGKIVRQVNNEIPADGKYSNTFNIEDLANGPYVILLKAGDMVHKQAFIKQ